MTRMRERTPCSVCGCAGGSAPCSNCGRWTRRYLRRCTQEGEHDHALDDLSHLRGREFVPYERRFMDDPEHSLTKALIYWYQISPTSQEAISTATRCRALDMHREASVLTRDDDVIRFLHGDL